MTEIKRRPESPDLDDAQMKGLRDFISGMDEAQLKTALQQLVNESQSDPGLQYSQGGTPANVTRTYIAIQDALEQITSKKQK